MKTLKLRWLSQFWEVILNALGGPRAISWPTTMLLVFVYFIFSARLHVLATNNGIASPPIPLTWLGAVLIMLGVLLLADGTILRNRKQGGVHPLWSVLVYLIIAVSVLLYFDLITNWPGNKWLVLPPQVVLQVVLIIGVTVVTDLWARQTQAWTELQESMSQLTRMRVISQEHLQRIQASVTHSVVAEVGPALRVLDATIAVANAPTQRGIPDLSRVATEVRAIAIGVIRELSHVLAKPEALPEQGSWIPTAPRMALSGSVVRSSQRIEMLRQVANIALTDAFPALPIAGLTMVISSVTTIRGMGYAAGSVVVFTLGLVLLLYLVIAQRLIPPVLKYVPWPLQIAGLGMSYAVIGGVAAVSVWYATRVFPFVAAENLAVPVFAVVIPGAFGVLSISIAWVFANAALQLRAEWLRRAKVLQASLIWEHAASQAAADRIRMRVARTLHGDFQGRLTAVALSLDLAEQSLRNQADAQAQLQAKVVLEQARKVLTELQLDLERICEHPPSQSFEDQLVGLTKAWRGLVEIEVSISAAAADAIAQLGGSIDEFLLDCVREGTVNAVRHGNAQHINVAITAVHDTIEVQILDDGVGVNEQQAGVGLSQLAAVGADVELTARTEGGMALVIRLPLSAV